MTIRVTKAVLAIFALSLPAVASPTAGEAQQVAVNGQVRPRVEYRDPTGASGSEAFTSMRSRVGLQAALDRGVSLVLQVQDVRIWGEEGSPLGDFSANGLDMHQAYLLLESPDLPWLTARVGRMETPFGGERLIGAVGWAQQAQSFDGVRLGLGSGNATVSALAFTLRDAAAPGVSTNAGLYGAYGEFAEVGPGALDAYWLWNRITAASDTNEHLIGARYVFSDGDVNGRVESTVARGTRGDVDVSAFMAGARIGTSFEEGRSTATLWFDYLSGDDPTTADVEVFNTFFGTNHKFYGFADLFLNIPAHTGGAGLQDIAVKLNRSLDESTGLGVDLHFFRPAQTDIVEDRFGEELDLTLRHRYSSTLTATAGLSYVWAGDGLQTIGRLSENMTWFYVMLDARF